MDTRGGGEDKSSGWRERMREGREEEQKEEVNIKYLVERVHVKRMRVRT